MGYQVWSAHRAAQAGAESVREFRTLLLDRDVDGAEAALERAQEETDRASSSLGGPLWGAAELLPGVGDDVAAARRLAATADDVTQGALPAVMTALSYVDPREIGFRGGRVRLGPLREGSDQLQRAAVLLERADTDAAAIRTTGLTAPLRSQVRDTQQQISDAARLSRNAAVAARLLPDMLGSKDRRNYLLLAQNPAEQRSLGGIPGAIALLRVEDGRIRLTKQVSYNEIGRFARPVLPLSEAERGLYGDVLGEYPQNVTDSPDFPRAAELVTEMWQRRIGDRIDGVASIDPYALQLLLRVVGPVQTQAGRLTGQDAARKLLVDVYRDVPDPEQQDAAFAQAARVVFDRVTRFAGDPRALTRALGEGVGEGRIMLWSVRPREQAVLRTIMLGQTLRDPTPETPRIGVYLHDRIGSKTSTYQRVALRFEPGSCGTTTSGRVTVSLRSAVPRGADLPPSVTGLVGRARPGDLRIQVVVYAPPGWAITGVDASDGRRDLITFKHDGLVAGTRDFTLAPGQRETLALEMEGQRISSDVAFRFTPGSVPDNVRREGSGCS